MTCISIVVFTVIVGIARSDTTFPRNFKFGAAASAYQIEGAWNVSDKTPSTWDQFSHQPGHIHDGRTGDMAADSYHHWRTDVQKAKELGLDYYRFSISWTRLLPAGFPTKVSEDGKKYYNNLIDELVRNNIEPLVTIFHWDLPQRLQDLGGWTNSLIADWFTDYAKVVFTLFGDRVKQWITINEPQSLCYLGYNYGVLAPGIRGGDVADYLCNKHTLLAHAKAWRLYDRDFRSKQGGRVSLASSITWLEPYAPEDQNKTKLTAEFLNLRFIHPVLSRSGGWPSALEQHINETSRKEGYPESILPALSQAEVDLIRGTYDFFGLNYYTSRLVRDLQPGVQDRPFPHFVPQVDCNLFVSPDWPPAYNGSWLYQNPVGFRKALKQLQQYDPSMEIIVTETGFPSLGNELDDPGRSKYLRDHLEQVYLSIVQDKVKVVGYTAWSLIDTFEWMAGYTNYFGLYKVDFSDPKRTRTPRQSARYYASVIRNRSYDVNV